MTNVQISKELFDDLFEVILMTASNQPIDAEQLQRCVDGLMSKQDAINRRESFSADRRLHAMGVL